MAATLQALRAVPELQTALNAFVHDAPNFHRIVAHIIVAPISYTPNPSVASAGQIQLTTALRDTYAAMSRTAESYTPLAFLQVLRRVVPQFGEIQRGANGMGGYAQQGA